MNRQERYRQRYRTMRPGWRDSLVLLIEQAGKHTHAHARLLDLGCGHADFLAPVYARAALAVGLDPDLAALRANDTADACVLGMAQELPFGDSTFDVVVSAWVLEHLDDPQPVFEEVCRVLKPGGFLIFLTPNAWNYAVWPIRLIPNRLHQMLVRRLYGRVEADTYPTRYRVNTPRQIEQVLSVAGLRRVELLFNGDPTYTSFNEPLFRLSCLIERLLDLPWLRRFRVHIIGVYTKPNG